MLPEPKPLALPLWRMINPVRHMSPFSGEGARLFGGRWNEIGVAALYLATDAVTAIHEYNQGNPKPGTLVPYRLDASAIVDLTSSTDPSVAAAVTGDWATIARIDHSLPPSWALARKLIAAGAEGALVPSFQHRTGKNLVLWHWHDARRSGPGAALTLIDPESVLVA